METTTQYTDQSYLDFIYDNYNSYDGVIEYLYKTEILSYEDFETGITCIRPYPELIINQQQYNNILPEKYDIYINHKISEYETALDSALNYYGDVTKVLKLFEDIKINDYLNFHPLEFTKQNITNNYISFLKENNLKVETWSDINDLGVIDYKGDFNNDYNNDFYNNIFNI